MSKPASLKDYESFLRNEDRSSPGVLIRRTEKARELGIISPSSNQPNVIPISPNAALIAKTALQAMIDHGEIQTHDA